MEIMNQERYEEYRQQLKEHGFAVFETVVNTPNSETYIKLEDRLGPMPWNFLKN